MLFIEGYLDTLSAAQGETVTLFASSNATQCSLTIRREGLDLERVLHTEPKLDIGEHPIPERVWMTGPNWPACWRFTIPRDWPSGVYRIDLLAEGERGGVPRYGPFCHPRAVHHVMLVVRAAQPAKKRRILLQLATNTYAAYNPWGGHSTYAYHSRDNKPSHAVSLLRPGHGYYGDTTFGNWERPFVHFCEREGIGVEYATNYDLHRWPAGFDDYRLILSVGHDEYWSTPMRDHLESFVARGGNAAFFSGNSVCWQVRFEGSRDETMIAYKADYRLDPHYAAGLAGDAARMKTVTTLWSNPILGRPENLLTGVGFRNGGYHLSHGAYMDGSGAFTVHRPDHWAFAGTNLKRGDSFGGPSTVVGYECDGCFFTKGDDGLPVPTGEDGTPRDFEILAQAPARWTDAERALLPTGLVAPIGQATLGVHTNPAGGTVITTGTTDWAHGLAGSAADAAAQRITRNILSRLT